MPPAPCSRQHGQAGAAGPWRQLLEWEKELHFSEEVQGRAALSRATEGLQQLTERLRAERRVRAGVSTASLAFGGTIGSLAFSSLDNKLSASQISLGAVPTSPVMLSVCRGVRTYLGAHIHMRARAQTHTHTRTHTNILIPVVEIYGAFRSILGLGRL